MSWSIGSSSTRSRRSRTIVATSLADQIRNGSLSIDQMLDNIKTKSENAFSNKTVERAKELDDQLKNAWRTLDQNLHPSLEALDNVMLSIKSAWIKVVELMGEAVVLSNKIRPASGFQGRVSSFDLDQQTLLQGRLDDKGLTPQQRTGVEAQLRAVQSRIAQAQAGDVPMAPTDFGYGGSDAVPLPKRRPDDVPKFGHNATLLTLAALTWLRQCGSAGAGTPVAAQSMCL